MFGFGGKTFIPDKDIPDLAGKVILVTGGNAGLGKETVLQLSKHNPSSIFLAARNRSKAEAAISEIKQTVPNANITFLELDLSSLKSVQAAAEQVTSYTDRLDILINNAGIMAYPEGKSAEGYELHFGTNHLGHALLTKRLLPLLEKTADLPGTDVRIVNLSSGAHVNAPTGGILFDKLKGEMKEYISFTKYGQSKLANILHANELAKRYPKIKCMSLHPGSVDTQITLVFKNNHPVFRYFYDSVLSWVLTDVSSGARNQLWCATGSDVVSGKYYVPVAKPDKESKYARDVKLREQLWDWTEKELATLGYS